MYPSLILKIIAILECWCFNSYNGNGYWGYIYFVFGLKYGAIFAL